MNILMLIDRYVPIWGGAENQLRQLIPHLQKKGCNVSILTRRWNGSLPKKETIDQINVNRVGIPGGHIFATILYLIGLLPYVICHRKSIDVIHTHGAGALGAIGYILGRMIKKPNIAKIATAGRISQLNNSFFGKLILKLLKQSSAIISLSEEINKELKSISIHDSKVHGIPNGVNIQRFSPLDRNNNTLSPFQNTINLKKPIIVFSGRFVPRKGIDILIKLWPDILKDCSFAQLVILGSGKDQPDSIENEIKKCIKTNQIQNVFFEGETSKPENYLKYADILAFPSLKEGFPNVLLEGMATGLAPVVFKISGVEELIDDENGFMVPLHDLKAYKNSFVTLLNDRDRIKKIGVNARKTVTGNYTFDIVSDKYIALYETLVIQN